MLLTNSSNVWRGRGKRQRREGASLRVSLPASVCLCSPGISFLSAAPRPLLLRLSTAGGHRPALPRLSGVSSPVSRESGTKGVPTPYTAKVPPGHWLSVSFAAECAARCGVRPLRWPVSQVERTRRCERRALSAPWTGTPPGSGALGALGPREPLLCWAHRYRVQLRNQANVSHPFIFTHKFYSFGLVNSAICSYAKRLLNDSWENLINSS